MPPSHWFVTCRHANTPVLIRTFQARQAARALVVTPRTRRAERVKEATGAIFQATPHLRRFIFDGHTMRVTTARPYIARMRMRASARCAPDIDGQMLHRETLDM